MALMETTALLQEMETYAEAHNVPILNANGRRFYAQFIREAQPHRFETIVGRLQAYLQLANTPPYQTEIFSRGDGLARTRRMTDAKGGTE